MRNTLTNKLKMYQTVASVCTKHQAVWSGVPAFAEAYNSFADQVSLLKEQAIIQEMTAKGVAEHKSNVLQNVIEKAVVVSRALSALALKNIDSELLARSLQSRSEWKRGNELVRVHRLQILLTDVNANEVALTEYGITPVFIDELDALITEYVDQVHKPRLAILDRKHATLMMEQKMRNIDVLLHGHMDRIIEVFRSADLTFVERYLDARIILDAKGKRRKKEEGESPDASAPPVDDGDGL